VRAWSAEDAGGVAEREYVTVRVSRRILWVGFDAYPLHNIVRAQTRQYPPDTQAMWTRFIGTSVGVLLLALVATIVAMQASEGESALGALLVIGAGCGLLIILAAYRLSVRLRTPTYYELVIDTSGSAAWVLLTTSYGQVTDLVNNIMDAIDNRNAEFQMRVENYHVGDQIGGDKITQYGERSSVNR
jgi:Family of unknown function (DUF6232)